MSRVLRLTLCEDCDTGFFSPNRGVQKKCPHCQRLHTKKQRWANYKKKLAKKLSTTKPLVAPIRKDEHPLPPATKHLPGTSNKIEVLTQRVEQKQELWNEEDAILDFSLPF